MILSTRYMIWLPLMAGVDWSTSTTKSMVWGFQSIPLPMVGTRSRSRMLERRMSSLNRLQYQTNKTEVEGVSTTIMDSDRQMTYGFAPGDAASITIPDEQVEELDATLDRLSSMYNWQSGAEFEPDEDEIEDFFDNFHEGDRPAYYPLTPTLELLKSWTLEYQDAVDMAGGMTRVSVGVANLFAPEYVFTSPSIGPINKGDFIKLMNFYHDSGLDFASAVPDLKVDFSGWHQDPHEPWRVWVMARYSGTHVGTATVPNSGGRLQLSPPYNHDHDREIRFTTGPEVQSFLWTPDKKILWQTMGHVGDSFTGSNEGYGGLEGLMVSMGLPRMYLQTTQPLSQMKNFFSQFSSSSDAPKTKSAYTYMPQWWHERKTYELNIHR